jgi:hypothetical protein
MVLRNPSLRRIKVERKQFCKFVNIKRPDGYHEALQHAMRVILVRLGDLAKRARVGVVQ